MGNNLIKSSDPIENLKILYSSDESKMNNMRVMISNNRRLEYLDKERSFLESLFRNQQILKNSGKIPEIHFFKVENFLNTIKNDVNEFELKNMNKQYDSFDNVNFTYTDNSPPPPRKDNYNDRLHNVYTQFMRNKNEGMPPIDKKDRIKPIENIEIDYYELYGYSKDQKIDADELKKKYRKFALQTHPDRNNGNDRNFNIIKKGYLKIMEDILIKETDKQYVELKNNSRDFIETQNSNNRQNVKLKFNKDNFDISKFNKVYSENKIEDVNDSGYGDWIQNNQFNSEDIKRNPKLNGNNFNSVFDSTVKENNTAIQKYQDPKSLFMNNYNNCTELGVDKVDNYTGETKTIKYTDYKEAHTTSKLVNKNTKYKQYRNIGELENARSNISDFSDDEKLYYEQKEMEKKRREHERIEKQKYLDNLHFKNYERVNNIMLR